jgi:hypothetical protein
MNLRRHPDVPEQARDALEELLEAAAEQGARLSCGCQTEWFRDEDGLPAFRSTLTVTMEVRLTDPIPEGGSSRGPGEHEGEGGVS